MVAGERSCARPRKPRTQRPVAAGEGDITVKPLTAARLVELAELFNEGGDPKWCWCMYFRTRGMDWSNSTPQGNRAGLSALARKRLAPGLVAYREGRAIGWMSLGPRESYDRLVASKVLAPLDDQPVWSVVCFVVSRRARGQGVAKALLRAGMDYARRHGATLLEAYPIAAERGRVAPSEAYHGTQSMFESAGFEVAQIRQWNKSTPRRPIMRLALR